MLEVRHRHDTACGMTRSYLTRWRCPSCNTKCSQLSREGGWPTPDFLRAPAEVQRDFYRASGSMSDMRTRLSVILREYEAHEERYELGGQYLHSGVFHILQRSHDVRTAWSCGVCQHTSFVPMLMPGLGNAVMVESRTLWNAPEFPALGLGEQRLPNGPDTAAQRATRRD